MPHEFLNRAVESHMEVLMGITPGAAGGEVVASGGEAAASGNSAAAVVGGVATAVPSYVYPCVLLAEVDDIVAPDPFSYPGGLREYLAAYAGNVTANARTGGTAEGGGAGDVVDSGGEGGGRFPPCVSTIGMQLAHISEGDRDLEPPLDWSRDILSQRHYWGTVRASLLTNPWLASECASPCSHTGLALQQAVPDERSAAIRSGLPQGASHLRQQQQDTDSDRVHLVPAQEPEALPHPPAPRRPRLLRGSTGGQGARVHDARTGAHRKSLWGRRRQLHAYGQPHRRRAQRRQVVRVGPLVNRYQRARARPGPRESAMGPRAEIDPD